MNKVLAWHFSPLDCLLANGDGRKIVAGESLSVSLPLTLCKRGLHGSVNILDALNYAPGPMLWRVEISGEILEEKDKLCGETRKALWGFDCRDLLFSFARECALDVIGNWKAPEIVRQFLMTGDISLKYAAESAAESAAWSAAESAAKAKQATKLNNRVMDYYHSHIEGKHSS